MPSRVNYERELTKIKNDFVLMCRNIESAIETSMKTLATRDPVFAQEVYREHEIIDGMEREIEGASLRLLMMEQPVAGDFREISAVLKMLTDLERMGDQAWDIAEIAVQFNDRGHIESVAQVTEMAAHAIQMVRDGVSSYINRDLPLARSMDAADDKVDALFAEAVESLTKRMKTNTDDIEQAIKYIMIAKYLERIADHAVNVGEWVEYALTGAHPSHKKV